MTDVGKFSHIFDPYPPTVGSFLVLSVGKYGKFLTPPPLEHADVLNGWSLRSKVLQQQLFKTELKKFIVFIKREIK